MTAIRLEVCVDDAEGLDAAIRCGADRIELCAALELGGLTPAPGLIARAAEVAVPVYAMIRPRAGDFRFGEPDGDTMRRDIDAVRAAGLAGVVLGASLPGGALDVALLGRLARHAEGLGCTLHRAFDLVPDIGEAVEAAIGLGFERILTSGGARRAIDGASRLRASVAAARGRIGIMPGAGVSVDTIRDLRAIVPFSEVHASCSEPAAGSETAARALGFGEAWRRTTNGAAVARLKAACRAL